MQHHITPVSVYYRVFAILLALLVLTVAAAYMHYPIEALGIVIAVTIAVVKAALIVLYFMQVRYSGKLTAVAASSGFVWLFILLALLGSDVAVRRGETHLDLVRPGQGSEMGQALPDVQHEE